MLTVYGLALLFLACWAEARQCESGAVYATCVLQPGTSSSVVGTIDIRQSLESDCSPSASAEYRIKITGLPTGVTSEHGFHVHQYGDYKNGCLSFGSHFNPTHMNHGGPTSSIRHVGDLGNLRQTAEGTISATIFDSQALLTGSQSIVGRGIVLHENRDDLGLGGDAESLKTGNAGARVACCVIGWSDGSGWSN